MLKEKQNLSFTVISSNKGKLIEQVVIRDDTSKNLKNTVRELCIKLKEDNEYLDEYDYFFKPVSNINETAMNDTDKYCMTYTMFDGKQVVLLNKTKKQILRKVKTLRLLNQTDAYEYASLFNMKDAMDYDNIKDVYGDIIAEVMREHGNNE